MFFKKPSLATIDPKDAGELLHQRIPRVIDPLLFAFTGLCLLVLSVFFFGIIAVIAFISLTSRLLSVWLDSGSRVICFLDWLRGLVTKWSIAIIMLDFGNGNDCCVCGAVADVTLKTTYQTRHFCKYCRPN